MIDYSDLISMHISAMLSLSRNLQLFNGVLLFSWLDHYIEYTYCFDRKSAASYVLQKEIDQNENYPYDYFINWKDKNY